MKENDKRVMVEVFRTNVNSRRDATILIVEIRKRFSDYVANFDLNDCDRILRIKCTGGYIQSSAIVDLLEMYGFNAEVLSDQYPVTTNGESYLGFYK